MYTELKSNLDKLESDNKLLNEENAMLENQLKTQLNKD